VPPISVLVVDDHALFADVLKVRLMRESFIESVDVAYTAADATARLRAQSFDVAVLDFVLDEGTALDLLAVISAESIPVHPVVLSAFDAVQDILDALMLGLRAWLPKTVDTNQLIRAVQGVSEGEVWLSPVLLGKVLDGLVARTSRAPSGPLDALTSREREVLEYMAEGMARADIASTLRVSVNTVRTHVQNLISKLGVHSTLEAVAMALGNEQVSVRSRHA
jgi:DNA-binding NarL/FixJ family response regulator